MPQILEMVEKFPKKDNILGLVNLKYVAFLKMKCKQRKWLDLQE